jgi:hypothetical protein
MPSRALALTEDGDVRELVCSKLMQPVSAAAAAAHANARIVFFIAFDGSFRREARGRLGSFSIAKRRRNPGKDRKHRKDQKTAKIAKIQKIAKIAKIAQDREDRKDRKIAKIRRSQRSQGIGSVCSPRFSPRRLRPSPSSARSFVAFLLVLNEIVRGVPPLPRRGCSRRSLLS